MRVFEKTIDPFLQADILLYNILLTKNNYQECKLSKTKHCNMALFIAQSSKSHQMVSLEWMILLILLTI
jgi:hypothetical protein